MGLFDRLRGEPTLDRFAARLIAALRRAGGPDVHRYDRERGRILHLRDGQVVGVSNLGNLYRTYCGLPRAERRRYLQTCLRTTGARARPLPEDFESARPDLRPKIWPRAALERARLGGLLGEPAGDPEQPAVPVGEHLVVTPAYDWPDSIQSIPASTLRDWGVSLYEVLEAARANLEETTVGYAQIGDGLDSFLSGDTYDACRLLLVDRIRALEVAGRHVAMAPNRDTLLITGDADEAGLALLATMAEAALAEPYPLCAAPLILEGDDWEDWEPPPGHPLAARFRGLMLDWIGPEYTEQKRLLDAVHRRQGVDVFVASYSAVQEQDGRCWSYCVWGQGVDTLLPVAQRVFLMQAGRQGPAAVGDWSRVREVVGDLMEPTEHYPTRYRVRSFPDAAALAAIGDDAP